jgi:hypothetical protein
VFCVRGHPQAQFAYAWTREDNDGTRHHIAVLGVPPINSAQNVVKRHTSTAHVAAPGIPHFEH